MLRSNYPSCGQSEDKITGNQEMVWFITHRSLPFIFLPENEEETTKESSKLQRGAYFHQTLATSRVAETECKEKWTDQNDKV